MKENSITNSLIHFIENTPTPYHIYDEIRRELLKENSIKEEENYFSSSLIPNTTYLIKKRGAVAFLFNKKITEKTRFHIWGAHSDSPSLKIRSNSNRKQNNLTFLKTEIYGGPIINTWLDRTFSLAGKIYYQENNGIKEKLVNFNEPLLTIPNAAIHINREINKGFKIDKEKHLSAIFSCQEKELENFLSAKLAIPLKSLLSYDLQLSLLEKPSLLGENQEMIHSPRLDNLLMCHAGLQGFLASRNQSDDNIIPLVIFFNHEEIGSRSDEGALSFFLKDILDGLLEGKDSFTKKKIINQSFFISADVAHAFHPQYNELYEEGNNVLFGKGIVLKYSSNRHYVSESSSVAYIKNILLNNSIPFQEANSHGEIPCGTTIGPLINSQLGIPTIDLGSPLLAMHSIKELASIRDHEAIIQLAKTFLKNK